MAALQGSLCAVAVMNTVFWGQSGRQWIQPGRGCADAVGTEGNMEALKCCVPTGWEMPLIPDHSLPSMREIVFPQFTIWNLETQDHMLPVKGLLFWKR